MKTSKGGKQNAEDEAHEVEKRVRRRLPHAVRARVSKEKTAFQSQMSKRKYNSVIGQATAFSSKPTENLELTLSPTGLAKEPKLSSSPCRLTKKCDLPSSPAGLAKEPKLSSSPCRLTKKCDLPSSPAGLAKEVGLSSSDSGLSSQSELAKRKGTTVSRNRDDDFDLLLSKSSVEVFSSIEPITESYPDRDLSSSQLVYSNRKSLVNKTGDNAIDIAPSKTALSKHNRHEELGLSVSQSLPELKFTVVKKESLLLHGDEAISSKSLLSDRNQIEDFDLISSSSRESVVVNNETKFENEKPKSNQNEINDLSSYQLESSIRKSWSSLKEGSDLTQPHSGLDNVKLQHSENNQIENFPLSSRTSHELPIATKQSRFASQNSKSLSGLKRKSNDIIKKPTTLSKRKKNPALFLSVSSRRKSPGVINPTDLANREISSNSPYQDNNYVHLAPSDSESLTNLKELDFSYQLNSSRTELNQKEDCDLTSTHQQLIRQKLKKIIQEPNSGNQLISSNSANSVLLGSHGFLDDKAVLVSGSKSNTTYCSKWTDSNFTVCSIEALNGNHSDEKELVPNIIAGTEPKECTKDERLNGSTNNDLLNLVEEPQTKHFTNESTAIKSVLTKPCPKNEQPNVNDQDSFIFAKEKPKSKRGFNTLSELPKDQTNNFKNDLFGNDLGNIKPASKILHLKKNSKNVYSKCSTKDSLYPAEDQPHYSKESLKHSLKTKSLNSTTTRLTTQAKPRNRILSTGKDYFDDTGLKRSNLNTSQSFALNDTTRLGTLVKPGSKIKSAGPKVPKAKKSASLSFKLPVFIGGLSKSENHFIPEAGNGKSWKTFSTISISEVPRKTLSESEDEWFGDLDLYSRRSKSNFEQKRSGLIRNELSKSDTRDSSNAKLPLDNQSENNSFFKLEKPSVTTTPSGHNDKKLPKIPRSKTMPVKENLKLSERRVVRKKAVGSNHVDLKLHRPARTKMEFSKTIALEGLTNKKVSADKFSHKIVVGGKTVVRRKAKISSKESLDSEGNSDRNNSFVITAENECSNSSFIESLANEVSVEILDDTASVESLCKKASTTILDIKASTAILDIKASVERVDSEASVERADSEASVERVDNEASVERVDDEASVERVDDEASVERVDDEASVERSDDEASVERLDNEASVERVDNRALVESVFSKEAGLESSNEASLNCLDSKEIPVERPSKKTYENITFNKTKLSSKPNRGTVKFNKRNVIKPEKDSKISITNIPNVNYKIPKIKPKVQTNSLETNRKTLDRNIKEAWAKLPKMYGIGHSTSEKKAPAYGTISADENVAEINTNGKNAVESTIPDGKAVEINIQCEYTAESNITDENDAEIKIKGGYSADIHIKGENAAENNIKGTNYVKSNIMCVNSTGIIKDGNFTEISTTNENAAKIDKAEKEAENNNRHENTAENNNIVENTTEKNNIDENTTEKNNIVENTTEKNNIDENTTEKNNIDENTTENNNIVENTTEKNNIDENTTENNNIDENTTENNSRDENTTENNNRNENTTENNNRNENTTENNNIDENTTENNNRDENTTENNNRDENTTENNNRDENSTENNNRDENTTENNNRDENTTENNTTNKNSAESNIKPENTAKINIKGQNDVESNSTSVSSTGTTKNENSTGISTKNVAKINKDETVGKNRNRDENTTENNVMKGNSAKNNATPENVAENDTTEANAVEGKKMDGNSVECNNVHENNAKINSTRENTAKINSTRENTVKINSTRGNTVKINSTHENTAKINSTRENTAKINSTRENTVKINSMLENTAKMNSSREITAGNATTCYNCDEINSKAEKSDIAISTYTDKITVVKKIPEGRLFGKSQMNEECSTAPSGSHDNYESTTLKRSSKSEVVRKAKTPSTTISKKMPLQKAIQHGKKNVISRNSALVAEGKTETLVKIADDNSVVKQESVTHNKKNKRLVSPIKRENAKPILKTETVTLGSKREDIRPVAKRETAPVKKKDTKLIIKTTGVTPGVKMEKAEVVTAQVRKETTHPTIKKEPVTPRVNMEKAGPTIKSEGVTSQVKETPQLIIKNESVTHAVKIENAGPILKTEPVTAGIKREATKPVLKIESVTAQVKREGAKPFIKTEHVTPGVKRKGAYLVESVPARIKNEIPKPITKTEHVTPGVKRKGAYLVESVPARIKNEIPKPITKTEHVTPGVKRKGAYLVESVSARIKNEIPKPITKTEHVTPGVKRKGAYLVESVPTRTKNESAKPITKTKPVTPGVKMAIKLISDSSRLKSENVKPFIKNESINQEVKMEDAGQTIKLEAVTSEIEREGENTDVKVVTAQLKRECEKHIIKDESNIPVEMESARPVEQNESKRQRVKAEGVQRILRIKGDTSVVNKEGAKMELVTPRLIRKGASLVVKKESENEAVTTVVKRKVARCTLKSGVTTWKAKNEEIKAECVTPLTTKGCFVARDENKAVTSLVKTEDAPSAKRKLTTSVIQNESSKGVKNVSNMSIQSEFFTNVVKTQSVSDSLSIDDEVKPLSTIKMDRGARSVVKRSKVELELKLPPNGQFEQSIKKDDDLSLKANMNKHWGQSDYSQISKETQVGSLMTMAKLSPVSENERSLLSLPLIEQPHTLFQVSKDQDLNHNVAGAMYKSHTADMSGTSTTMSNANEGSENYVSHVAGHDIDSVSNFKISKDTVDNKEVVTNVSTPIISNDDFITHREISNDESTTPIISSDDSMAPLILRGESLTPIISNHESTTPIISGDNSIAPITSNDETTTPKIGSNDSIAPEILSDESLVPITSNHESITPIISREKSIAPITTSRDSIAPIISNDESKASIISSEELRKPEISIYDSRSRDHDREKSTEEKATTIGNYQELTSATTRLQEQDHSTSFRINKEFIPLPRGNSGIPRHPDASRSPATHHEYSRSNRYDREDSRSPETLTGCSRSPWKPRDFSRAPRNYQESSRSLRYEGEFSRASVNNQQYSRPPRRGRGHWRPPWSGRGDWRLPREYSTTLRGAHDFSVSSRRWGPIDGETPWRQPLNSNPELQISRQWLSSHECPVDTRWKFDNAH